jgi:hypothetical protein
MAQIDSALAAHRAAVAELLDAGERTGAAWTSPRAPGKWSPAQIVEHIARSIEESVKMIAGEPSMFPSLPWFVRPLVRALAFDRTLRRNVFPSGRTGKAFNPESGSSTAAEARVRLDALLDRFDAACRARAAAGGSVVSGMFGKVSVGDYARFMALHAAHHLNQMPAIPGHDGAARRGTSA